MRIFLVVRCLRLCTSNAGAMSLVPDWGTKIPKAAWYRHVFCFVLFCFKCQLMSREWIGWTSVNLVKVDAKCKWEMEGNENKRPTRGFP